MATPTVTDLTRDDKTRLIMENMAMDKGPARRILENNREVGGLPNEEYDDIMVGNNDQDADEQGTMRKEVRKWGGMSITNGRRRVVIWQRATRRPTHGYSTQAFPRTSKICSPLLTRPEQSSPVPQNAMALPSAFRLSDRSRFGGDMHRSWDQEHPGKKAWLSHILASNQVENSAPPDMVITLAPTQKTHTLPRLDEAIQEIDLAKTTLPSITTDISTSSNAHGPGAAAGTAVLEQDVSLRRASLPRPLLQLSPLQMHCEALTGPNDSYSTVMQRPTSVRETPAATIPTVASLSQSPKPQSSSTTDVEELATERDSSTTASQTRDGRTGPRRPNAFVCDFPCCTAAPFRTLYLLRSHAPVHCSDRPFYCSVRGCPRSEGGKGFKRKNDMRRHGLVHDSPGHVQQQHPEQDENDPHLQFILAQKPGNLSLRKGRRDTRRITAATARG
ncbi:hypothetical protein MKZ38_002493 [Zalerion maritima]|uniref:C2H2-type domain-containing protein n=1 Tax=Zalerion maritima TaxID=339359 RepID=A0AAD5RQG4_9PEZI|nr:hypothetical protein MKZ38_002493 [Zalerion maritima]